MGHGTGVCEPELRPNSVIHATSGAPATSAHAAVPATTAPVAPISQCSEFPIGAPGGCDFFQDILLGTGSATLGADWSGLPNRVRATR